MIIFNLQYLKNEFLEPILIFWCYATNISQLRCFLRVYPCNFVIKMPQQHNQNVRSTEILVEDAGGKKPPSLLNVLGFQNLTRFRGRDGGGQNKNLSRSNFEFLEPT